MKKTVLLGVVSSLLMACAGNPPAWWNPRHMQTGPTDLQKQTVAKQKEAESRRPTLAEPMDTEELIGVTEESYEEMPLTPLQDEEQENDSGESTSQLMDDPEELIPSILED